MFKILILTACLALVAATDESHAEIEHLENNVHHAGFEHNLKTSNHIEQGAKGDEHGNIHGDFSWISPEGEHVAVKYVADEYGYQPSSAHLPVAPPVPDYIQRAIAYIAAHPPAPEPHHH